MAKDGRKMHPNSLANMKPNFSKENQPANRGQKPSKVAKFISEYSLTHTDVTNLSKSVLQMNEKEIKEKMIDSKAPIILRLFCRFLLSDMKSGNAKNIHMLMDRAVGKVKEQIEIEGNMSTSNGFTFVDPPKRVDADTSET